jgi:hypothetical protein
MPSSAWEWERRQESLSEEASEARKHTIVKHFCADLRHLSMLPAEVRLDL